MGPARTALIALWKSIDKSMWNFSRQFDWTWGCVAGAGGTVRYSLKRLEGNSSELFTIEPEDGSVYLRKSLDRELQSLHKLQITATDCGVPNLSTSVHLWVKGNAQDTRSRRLKYTLAIDWDSDRNVRFRERHKNHRKGRWNFKQI